MKRQRSTTDPLSGLTIADRNSWIQYRISWLNVEGKRVEKTTTQRHRAAACVRWCQRFRLDYRIDVRSVGSWRLANTAERSEIGDYR